MVAFTPFPSREYSLVEGSTGGRTSWWQMPGGLPILLSQILLTMVKSWVLPDVPHLCAVRDLPDAVLAPDHLDRRCRRRRCACVPNRPRARVGRRAGRFNRARFCSQRQQTRLSIHTSSSLRGST